ncbi:MAG: hypothetical protein FWF95_00750 [Syntrophorhabdaceae bacterium]|nr:hypothetical protein [Syntrophorhabdaceae bacterium]
MARRTVRVYLFNRSKLSSQSFLYAQQSPESQNHHQKNYADVNHALIAAESRKLRVTSFFMPFAGFKNIKKPWRDNRPEDWIYLERTNILRGPENARDVR